MEYFSIQEQRVLIRYLYLRGMTAIEIHRQLSDTCKGVMDVKNVRMWVRRFVEGRESCENMPKKSRPRTSRTKKIIARVEEIIKEDPRICVRDIASEVGISVGSVQTILHQDLGMLKVSSSWQNSRGWAIAVSSREGEVETQESSGGDEGSREYSKGGFEGSRESSGIGNSSIFQSR